MRTLPTVTVAVVLALALGLGGVVGRAAAQTPPEESSAESRTPPRLSFVDGQASFWRPGAPEWAAAQINTPIAPGDELSTGSPGNFEIQIGARAFVRAWANTALGLVNQEPDFIQIKVTAGYASLDLRALDPGRVVEVDTPGAAFTIEHPGYYRVEVVGDRTEFITRRGGRATVTTANGQAAAIAPSEEIVIEGTDVPRIATYVAPPLDDWDRWNYARTDYHLDSVSTRHASPAMYGVSDLDRHGRWRVVPDYGSIWVPTTVPAGWAPYSTGSWTWDPYYGWTWVDTMPWGWAPFHYGRWVHVDGYWGWTPGPVVARPVYAPALVAFFGAGGGAVRVGSPVVGWVALGWGEPVIPWWGAPRFVGMPWWGGWGGPRVVNNVVINRTTVVNVQNITVYRHASVQSAVVVVDHHRFGHGPIGPARHARVDVRGLEPVRGRVDVRPVPASFAPTTVKGVRPSDERFGRPVVATRAPHPGPSEGTPEVSRKAPGVAAVPPPRLVPAPRETDATPRAPRGVGRTERPQSPPAPRFGGQPEAQPKKSETATPAGRGPSAPATREAPPAVGIPSAPKAPQPAVTRTTPEGAPPEARTTPKVAPPTLRGTPEGTPPTAPTTPPVAPPTVRSTPQAPSPVAPRGTPEGAPPAARTTPQVAPPTVRSTPPASPVMAPRAPQPAQSEGARAPRPAVVPPASPSLRESQASPSPRPAPPARVEAPRPQPRALPGEAADRLSPGRDRKAAEAPKNGRGAGEQPRGRE